MYWLPASTVADGVDRLAQEDHAARDLVERRYEYRLVFDQEKQSWRLDRRATG